MNTLLTQANKAHQDTEEKRKVGREWTVGRGQTLGRRETEKRRQAMRGRFGCCWDSRGQTLKKLDCVWRADVGGGGEGGRV